MCVTDETSHAASGLCGKGKRLLRTPCAYPRRTVWHEQPQARARIVLCGGGAESRAQTPESSWLPRAVSKFRALRTGHAAAAVWV